MNDNLIENRSLENDLHSNTQKKDSFYKKFVFKQLNYLKFGHLTIIENNRFYEFGNASSDVKVSIKVFNAIVYKQLLLSGSIGAAESYIEGYWDCDDLTALIEIFALNQALLDKFERGFSFISFFKNRILHLRNNNNKKQAKKNILAHYDLSNDMYSLFLDKRMLYSSAIFPTKDISLEMAQEYKLKNICDKLNIKPNDHVLEIGTGWGALAIYIAQHYNCYVTTTTISEAQYEYAKNSIENAGLSDKITLLKQDYRELKGSYDRVVSIEMIEAVGHKYLANFFSRCNDLLKTNGVLLIQAITIADQRYNYYRTSVDFIQKYIFPGGCLPSIAIMSKHISENTSMVIQGIEDFGQDYETTLSIWQKRFNDNTQKLLSMGFDNKFIRLWNYYLAYCQGGFKHKQISVVHLSAQKLNTF